jgi:hypothetical protein
VPFRVAGSFKLANGIKLLQHESTIRWIAPARRL